jgi:hypothetical protein
VASPKRIGVVSFLFSGRPQTGMHLSAVTEVLFPRTSCHPEHNFVDACTIGEA